MVFALPFQQAAGQISDEPILDTDMQWTMKHNEIKYTCLPVQKHQRLSIS